VFACDKSVVPSEVLEERRALAQRGAVTVTLLTDRDGKLIAEPTIIALGVLSPRERDVLVLAKNAARKSYERLREAGTFDEAALIEAVRLAVRGAIEQEVATKTQVFVSRVAAQS
jgi:mRNA degradation ribonuclease J1/J2